MRNLGKVFLFCFSFPLFSSYPSLYRPYQRDLIILIDWHSELESLSFIFDASRANIDKGLGGAANSLASALYNPSVPVIASTSIWKSILERAQIIADSANLSSEEFVNKYYKKYKTDYEYQNSLLIDTQFLKMLYAFCRKSYQTYHQLNNSISAAALKHKKVNFILNTINSQYADPSLGGILTSNEDLRLWQGVNELLLCFLIVQKIKEDRNEWILRKPDPCTILMIPKSYLNGVKEKVYEFAKNRLNMSVSLDELLYNSLRDSNSKRFLTVDEIILGLKFENWAELPDPFSVPEESCEEKYNSYLSDRFIKKQNKIFSGVLPEILMNQQDYKTYSQEKFLTRSDPAWLPEFISWNVFGFGHGSPPLQTAPEQDINYYTMGLRENAMIALLDFFDSINTRMLFYASCYAGGQRLRSLYLDHEKDRILKKKFKYTIAVSAITQIATLGVVFPMNMPPYNPPLTNSFVVSSLDMQKLRVKPFFYPNFNAFFNDLHTIAREIIDYKTGKKIVKPVSYKDIFLHVVDFLSKEQFYANIPQIRFAGTAWFNVIDLPDKLLRLTKTFLKTQEAEINLGVKDKLTIKNKNIVLVDAEQIWHPLPGYAHSEVDFALEIKGAMPKFISMVDGNAWHAFDKVDARSFGLLNVLNQFWGLQNTFYGRTFFMRELLVRNDLSSKQSALIGTGKNPVLSLKNVYIFSHASGPRDYQLYKTVLDNVVTYFKGKHININSLYGLNTVLKNSGVQNEVADSFVSNLLMAYQMGGIKKIEDIKRIILQHSFRLMQGITFMFNNSLYSSKFSLLDKTQVNSANQLLRKGVLPFLQNIGGPLPSYRDIISIIFPKESLHSEPTYEKVAQLIMDKKKQVILIEEYERRKIRGQKIVTQWKNTLTHEDRKFVELYEQSLIRAERKPHLNILLRNLEIQLQGLSNAL